MQLIGEKGIDAVTMREVAARAGGPIASVYQYFPNKSAIIAALYERYSENVRSLLDVNLADIGSREDVFRAAELTLYTYYDNIRSNPALQDMLNAIHADKALHSRDIAETRVHAALFTAATRQFVAETSWERYDRVAFMLFQLTASTVRLALQLPDQEATGILADYREILHAQLRTFMETCPA